MNLDELKTQLTEITGRFASKKEEFETELNRIQGEYRAIEALISKHTTEPVTNSPESPQTDAVTEEVSAGTDEPQAVHVPVTEEAQPAE